MRFVAVKYPLSSGKRLLVSLVLFISCFITKVTFASVSCSQIKKANDILKCLQVKHPEVIDSETINTVSENLASQGNAWKNPELSFQTVGGQNLGSSVFDSEFRISQTIGLSGLRSAQRKKGLATGEAFRAESMGKIEDVTLMGIQSLYRLSQLKDEMSKIEEAIQSIKQIKKQYQSRLRLNPEQEITLGMIQLSISEFEIKLNQVNSEKKEIISELMASTHLTTDEIESNLPIAKNVWPKMSGSDSDVKSSSLMKAKANVNLSESMLQEARAEAWPEFTLSLIAQNKIDGPFQYQTFGAGISFPMPLFQRNQGEKSLKAVEYSRAQNVYNATMKKEESLLNNTLLIYESSVKNLQNTPSNTSIESKHKRAETLFSQGLISGPLILETHRQILEYTQSRNQEELRAMVSLWRLYILKGNFLDQII
jgi:cobalt-zinc-cadmium efflux system outer membrane protein